MVVVIGTRKQTLVEIFLGFFEKPVPNGVAVFRRTERQQTERRIRKTVFRVFFVVGLGGDAAGAEVYNIAPFDFRKPRSAVEFAQCESGVPGFVVERRFVFDRSYGAVFVNSPDVFAQNRTGHIHTLLGKIQHLTEKYIN